MDGGLSSDGRKILGRKLLKGGGFLMKKIDQPKRTFIKKMVLVAGSILALKSGQARASTQEPSSSQDQILYRETEAFKAYYKSLRC